MVSNKKMIVIIAAFMCVSLVSGSINPNAGNVIAPPVTTPAEPKATDYSGFVDSGRFLTPIIDSDTGEVKLKYKDGERTTVLSLVDGHVVPPDGFIFLPGELNYIENYLADRGVIDPLEGSTDQGSLSSGSNVPSIGSTSDNKDDEPGFLSTVGFFTIGGGIGSVLNALSKVQWNEFVYEFSEGAQFGNDVTSIMGWDDAEWMKGWEDAWTAFFMDSTFGAWVGGFWEEEICRVDTYADDVEGAVVVDTDGILHYGMHVEAVRSQPGLYYDEDLNESAFEYFYKISFVFVNNLSSKNNYNLMFGDDEDNWVYYYTVAWPEVDAGTTVNGAGDNIIVDYSPKKYTKIKLVIDKPIEDHNDNEVSEVENSIDSPEYEEVSPSGSSSSSGSADGSNHGGSGAPTRNPDF